MAHERPDPESGTDPPETPWKIYMAAAVGALIISLGDLMAHPHMATAVRLREQLFGWAPEEGGRWLALALLIGLGVALSWVHQPRTRVDAFARGFSVFAVLAVASPTVEDDGSLISTEPDDGTTPGANSVGVPGGGAYSFSSLQDPVIQLPPPKKQYYNSKVIKLDNVSPGSTIWITLRDRKTGKVIVKQSLRTDLFRISQPPGEYQLQVEQKGHRRLTVPFDLSENERAVSGLRLDIPRSKVPLGFQKLFSPKQTQGDIIPPSPALDAMLEALRRRSPGLFRPPQPDSGTTEDRGRSPASGSAVELV